MVGRLDDTTKHQIVLAYKRHENVAKVARECGVNEKTVRRWVRRHAETGNVSARKPGGIGKVITDEAASMAVQLLLDPNFATTSAVAAELNKQGLTEGTQPVHMTTLSRATKAKAAADGCPIVVAKGKPAKQLTTSTIAKRLQFCQANKSRNWSHVMFSDRKKFSFRYPGSQVRHMEWVKKGQQRQAYTPNHPMVLNVYAGITKYGVTKVHKVTGSSKMKTNFKNKQGKEARNITSAEYAKVLEDSLLPEGCRLFNQKGISNWVFQQDNDPTHKKASKAAIQAWNQAHLGQAITLLADWPPNSPDSNLIENVWAWAQRKVDATRCKTFEEFEKCVITTMKNVPSSMLKNLYASMRERESGCARLPMEEKPSIDSPLWSFASVLLLFNEIYFTTNFH